MTFVSSDYVSTGAPIIYRCSSRDINCTYIASICNLRGSDAICFSHGHAQGVVLESMEFVVAGALNQQTLAINSFNVQ